MVMHCGDHVGCRLGTPNSDLSTPYVCQNVVCIFTGIFIIQQMSTGCLDILWKYWI